jgi:adenosylcobinamide-GDP ribazoletransferase
MLAQVAALSSAPTIIAVVVAAATGRLAIGWACRRGVPAARPDGLGALVAGTVGAVPLAVATAAVAGGAVAAVPGRAWQGPVAVAAALAAALLLTRHAVRRFGGITGDVLGAACEVSATVALVVLVL